MRAFWSRIVMAGAAPSLFQRTDSELPQAKESRLRRYLGMAGGLGAFLIVLAAWNGPARADNVKGPTLAQVAQELVALQARVTTLEGTVSSLIDAVHSLQGTVAREADLIGSLQAEVTSLQNVQFEHQQKLQYVTVTGTDMMITGANLHVRNKLGDTETSNGLGNLIVGYNENSTGASRTGSHNIVVGTNHWYSSYGGLIVGRQNAIDAPYASVTGGFRNNALSFAASVSGGDNNTASASSASVSGGSFNSATERGASVSGGFFNTAGGLTASASGGTNLTQNHTNGWSGGAFHTP